MAHTILIVEDDSFLQSLAAKKLSSAGYTVITAGSIDAAKDRLKDNPELVLLDLLLPGGSGFDVLEAVRANTAINSIPVIVFSNLSETKDLEKAKSLGATRYMIKSNFTLDELLEEIKKLLK